MWLLRLLLESPDYSKRYIPVREMEMHEEKHSVSSALGGGGLGGVCAYFIKEQENNHGPFTLFLSFGGRELS